MRKILLVTYYFAPSDAISARRWSKMAAELIKLGHELEVICVNRAGEGMYTGDDFLKINVHQVKEFYPKILDSSPSNFFSKLKYKLSLLILKLCTNGTPYDRAILIKKRIQLKIKDRIIKFKPDTIIANGPPHRILYYTSILKQEFKHIKFISDFRDPWTWWYNLGYSSLNQIASKFENNMEKNVVENSDIILSPSENILEYLKLKYPLCEKKLMHLPHGYDERDFGSYVLHSRKKTNQKLRFMYFGTVYNRLDKEFEDICSLIKENDSQFDIYTNSKTYSTLVKTNFNENIIYHKPVKLVDLYKISVNFDAIILLMPPDLKNFLSSKFAEMIKLRLPVIIISARGYLSDFFVDNKLGIFVDIKSIKTEFPLIWNKLKVFEYNENFNIKKYEFSNLASEFINKTQF